MFIDVFKQGTDNFGYLLSNKKGEAVAIDPLDAAPYLNLLEEKKLRLVSILATHYHHDHIEGIPALLKKNQVPVIGPLGDAPDYVSEQVSDGPLHIDNFSLESYFLPGHSLSHCVFREPSKNWLFVGDILFHLGCGRVNECAPETLYASLQDLKEFHISSELFVGHDYREKNYRFCEVLDPKTYAALSVDDLELSTSLEMELWWNPFLKAASFDEWWELRQRRNVF